MYGLLTDVVHSEAVVMQRVGLLQEPASVRGENEMPVTSSRGTNCRCDRDVLVKFCLVMQVSSDRGTVGAVRFPGRWKL